MTEKRHAQPKQLEQLLCVCVCEACIASPGLSIRIERALAACERERENEEWEPERFPLTT